MTEGFPIRRTPSYRCPDCDAPLQAIRLMDYTSAGPSTLRYAAVEAEPGFFDGLLGIIPVLGDIDARICPQCGRIQLYGIVAPERARRTVQRAPQPAPAETPPTELPPIDPPQAIPAWQPEPFSLATSNPEAASPIAYEWLVQGSESLDRFATEHEAEAYAREWVNLHPEEHVVVIGPGRRYRVLP